MTNKSQFVKIDLKGTNKFKNCIPYRNYLHLNKLF